MLFAPHPQSTQPLSHVMANPVPTMSHVPFGVARVNEGIDGTTAARAKCEILTAAIADAVHSVPEADVLVRSFAQARCCARHARASRTSVPLTC